MITPELKNILEQNPVVVATTMSDTRPNAICVSSVKVVDEQIVITDNFMNQTVNDLAQNNNVCLLVWNKDLHGYKILGTAEYFNDGKWLEFVRSIADNEGFPAKGAIVVTVSKIIEAK